MSCSLGNLRLGICDRNNRDVYICYWVDARALSCVAARPTNGNVLAGRMHGGRGREIVRAVVSRHRALVGALASESSASVPPARTCPTDSKAVVAMKTVAFMSSQVGSGLQRATEVVCPAVCGVDLGLLQQHDALDLRITSGAKACPSEPISSNKILSVRRPADCRQRRSSSSPIACLLARGCTPAQHG